MRRISFGIGFAAAAVVMTSLWLGGCGPRSGANLREKLHVAHSSEVAADYQIVYDRIVRRARQRYVVTGIPTHQLGMSADLFPESRSAAVRLWDSGGIGIRYRITAEIRSLGPAVTQVDLRTTGKDDTKEAQVWAIWANTPLED